MPTARAAIAAVRRERARRAPLRAWRRPRQGEAMRSRDCDGLHQCVQAVKRQPGPRRKDSRTGQLAAEIVAKCAAQCAASNRTHAGCGDCALPLPSLLLRGATPGRSVDLTGGRFMPKLATAVFAPRLAKPSLGPEGRSSSRDVRDRRQRPQSPIAAGHCVLPDRIIRHMNDLSKDAVNWLAVGRTERASASTITSPRSFKGVPKSHVYRICAAASQSEPAARRAGYAPQRRRSAANSADRASRPP
jgi:hypothetical protein